MAACPTVSFPSQGSIVWRRPLQLSARRLAANRRNAMRSTGPRTPRGKARVARNAVKHGFFASMERWTPALRRDFDDLLRGLREDFVPRDGNKDRWVGTIAASYARMAALWRYESVAAKNYHDEREWQLNARITEAGPEEARALEEHRQELMRSGLWGPTLPGPRDAALICRYQGRLDREIRFAITQLKAMPGRCDANVSKSRKQTHLAEENRAFFDFARLGNDAIPQTKMESSSTCKPLDVSTETAKSASHENAKTNPLSSTFTGNRHARRRAKALARRRGLT